MRFSPRGLTFFSIEDAEDFVFPADDLLIDRNYSSMMTTGQSSNVFEQQDLAHLLQEPTRTDQTPFHSTPLTSNFNPVGSQQDAFFALHPPPMRKRRGHDSKPPDSFNGPISIKTHDDDQRCSASGATHPSNSACAGTQEQNFADLQHNEQLPADANIDDQAQTSFIFFEDVDFAQDGFWQHQVDYDTQPNDTVHNNIISTDQVGAPANGNYRQYIPQEYEHSVPAPSDTRNHQCHAPGMYQHDISEPAVTNKVAEHTPEGHQLELLVDGPPKQYYFSEEYGYEFPIEGAMKQQHKPDRTAYQGIETNTTDMNNSFLTDSSVTVPNLSSPKQEFGTPETNDSDHDRIQLHFSTLEEAMAYADNRSRLNIVRDDWHEMKAKPHPYVSRLVRIFKTTGTDTPRGHDLDTADQAHWDLFQNTHLDKVTHYAEKHPLAIELAAWSVFNACIEAHERGIKSYKHAEFRHSCSIRFNEVAQVIADYAIVRWDIIRLTRIEDLVRDPVAFTHRKMANFTGNTQKKKRDEENAEKAKQSGVQYDPVLGTKRKSTGDAKSSKTLGGQAVGRKRKRDTPVDFANDEPETEESLEEIRPQAPMKKRKAATIYASTPEAIDHHLYHEYPQQTVHYGPTSEDETGNESTTAADDNNAGLYNDGDDPAKRTNYSGIDITAAVFNIMNQTRPNSTMNPTRPSSKIHNRVTKRKPGPRSRNSSRAVAGADES